MNLPSAIRCAFAFAATIALFAAVSSSASALEGAQWFWTTENDQNPVTWQQCQDRAPAALATTGYQSGANGGYHWVNAPNFYIILLCINRPHGMNVFLSVTASDAGTASRIGTPIGNAFWQVSSASPGPIPGMTISFANGFVYVITRRGSTDDWDAVGSDGRRAVLHGGFSGNAGSFVSTYASDLSDCSYAMTIAGDGRSLSGAQTCQGRGPATVPFAGTITMPG
ncbi:MAG: hypothetical protein JO101_07060 [Candidatus Eremiobacteraeota bacterium]|nr:hypothetical protein [Candidatus Eremiobacteraeota bacterium]